MGVLLLTQNPTQNRKFLRGNIGTDSISECRNPERTPPNGPESIRFVPLDKLRTRRPGVRIPQGVLKPRKFVEFPWLCSFFCTFSGDLILQSRFDPSRDPYGSPKRKLSESAGGETAHRVRRLLLHGGGDMGASIQGEPSAVAARTDTITIGGELPQRQAAVLGGFDAERGDQK